MERVNVYSSPDAEALVAKAQEIEALLDPLKSNWQPSPGGSGIFYYPIKDKEVVARAAKLVGRELCDEDRERILWSTKPKAWLHCFMDYGRAIRELEERASNLRMKALGQKPYPIMVCPACHDLTGWLGEHGLCEVCQDRKLLKSNKFVRRNLLPAWMGQKQARAILSKGRKTPQLIPPDIERMHTSRGTAFLAMLLQDESLLRAEQRALWDKVVYPIQGLLAPAPELGAVFDVPVRYTQESTEDAVPLIRFGSMPYIWAGKRWERAAKFPHRSLPHPFPTTFPASTQASALDVAFEDFKTLVVGANLLQMDGPPRITENANHSMSVRTGETKTEIIDGRRITMAIPADNRKTLTIDIE